MEKNNLIAITEDITNCKKYAQIRRFLDENQIKIDTLYLSNICNFMKTDQQKRNFTKSLRYLLDEETLLINCPKKIQGTDVIILHQTLTLGKNMDPGQLFEITGTP